MTHLIDSLTRLFTRDLNKLESEIKLYPTDETVWIIKGDIKNSAGNLCLHLCGNLQHYVGGNLGSSGYKRNREAEFSTRGLTKEKLIEEINKTKISLEYALTNLPSKALDEIYPEQVFSEPMTTQHFLIHLLAHLGYHLGQVNYHRRLVL